MVEKAIEHLKNYEGRDLRIMEVCGTHTSAIFKHGIRSLISPKIRLISGPGCPVCVTPAGYIDTAIELAKRPDVRLYSFGDMLKVPGSERSLAGARAEGAKTSLVYSPLDLLRLAEAEPEKTHIMCAAGFETTAPVYALLLREAAERGIENIRLHTALKLTIPAIEYICENERGIDAFLCPGHVSVVTGSDAFIFLAERYKKPFVVGGFSGDELVLALYEIVRQLKSGECAAENIYPSAVRPEGNLRAKEALNEVFEIRASVWRGLGILPRSGLYLNDKYARYDAAELIKCDVSCKRKGNEADLESALPHGCRCTDVILGRIDPPECPLFLSAVCTPTNPLGPCMVSQEGACGIWYRNR